MMRVWEWTCLVWVILLFAHSSHCLVFVKLEILELTLLVCSLNAKPECLLLFLFRMKLILYLCFFT
jgi:hypothetical protein